MTTVTLRSGLRRIAALGALVLVPASLEAQNLPAAAELMATYTKAIGGVDAFSSMPGMRTVGSFAMPAMGLSAQMEALASPPNRALVRITIPGMGEVRQGYDGETAWAIDPNQGPRILAGDELKQMQDESSITSTLRIPENFQSAETVERTELNGEACYKVKLVWKSGRESFDCYSVDSGLIVASMATAETPMGAIETVSLVSDYKQFGNVIMPTKTVVQMMGMEQVLTVDSVEFRAIEASEFELPAEIKALKK